MEMSISNPVRVGAAHRRGSAQLIATGTSALTEELLVFAGMQRGSSVLSHHWGGSAGSSNTWMPPRQPSPETRSHAQSAAATDVEPSNSSIAATASDSKRGLMSAKKQSTAPAKGCNMSKAEDKQQGVRTGCKMSEWRERAERLVFCLTLCCP